MEDAFDVLVIGAGPAGLSAAVWCGELGLRSGVIESEQTAGGQLKRVFNPIRNYPGIEETNGDLLAKAFEKAATGFGARLITGSTAAKVDTASMSVTLSDGRIVNGRCLILATGVRRRRLMIPGENELSRNGLLESGSKDPSAVKDGDVLIVGGGDAAVENAVILAPFAGSVTVVHRGREFSARHEFVDKIDRFENVAVQFRTVVDSFIGQERLRSAVLRNLDTGRAAESAFDHALVRIGVEPNSELAAGKIELDARGYILVANDGGTSVPGVYAAGDVANPVSPTIVTAAGSGAAAAKAAHAWLSG